MALRGPPPPREPAPAKGRATLPSAPQEPAASRSQCSVPGAGVPCPALRTPPAANKETNDLTPAHPQSGTGTRIRPWRRLL
eukprot:2089930-Alexandrium_andersonii.AAC.1